MPKVIDYFSDLINVIDYLCYWQQRFAGKHAIVRLRVNAVIYEADHRSTRWLLCLFWP